jgi:hypothetical protein
LGAKKKIRKRAAWAELERLTQIAKAIGTVQTAVASARLAKSGRVVPPGEAMERDDLARVLAKSDNMQLRAGAMQRLEELDGQAAAMDEAHRVITKSGRSR